MTLTPTPVTCQHGHEHPISVTGGYVGHADRPRNERSDNMHGRSNWCSTLKRLRCPDDCPGHWEGEDTLCGCECHKDDNPYCGTCESHINYCQCDSEEDSDDYEDDGVSWCLEHGDDLDDDDKCPTCSTCSECHYEHTDEHRSEHLRCFGCNRTVPLRKDSANYAHGPVEGSLDVCRAEDLCNQCCGCEEEESCGHNEALDNRADVSLWFSLDLDDSYLDDDGELVIEARVSCTECGEERYQTFTQMIQQLDVYRSGR